MLGLRRGGGQKARTWAAKGKGSLSVNNTVRNAKEGAGGSLALVGLNYEGGTGRGGSLRTTRSVAVRQLKALSQLQLHFRQNDSIGNKTFCTTILLLWKD